MLNILQTRQLRSEEHMASDWGRAWLWALNSHLVLLFSSLLPTSIQSPEQIASVPSLFNFLYYSQDFN